MAFTTPRAQTHAKREKTMKVYGIIPARYGSSRLPGKPLRLIAGKPMIVRVYERAQKAGCWEKLVVATDDVRIKEAIESVGGTGLMTSRSHPSGTDRLAEACELLNLNDEDLVVNIQGDEPLLPYNAIGSMVDTFKRNPVASMGTLAFRATNQQEFTDVNVVKVVTDRNNYALYFSRAPIPLSRAPDTGPPDFLKHLGFYVYSVNFLKLYRKLPRGHLERIEKLEQLRVLENGYRIIVALSDTDSHGVDTVTDIARVEKIIEKQSSLCHQSQKEF